jgi:hypothetical protein
MACSALACTLMQPYGNLSNKSGIREFDIGDDFIDVRFVQHEPYRYTHESAGRDNVEQMKKLAVAGKGLGTFISQHPEVRHGYVKRR